MRFTLQEGDCGNKRDIGLYSFAGAFQGFLENRLNPFLRILSLLLAFFLIAPLPNLIHAAATVVFFALFVYNFKQQAVSLKTASP